MSSFLDKTGLALLWSRIKAYTKSFTADEKTKLAGIETGATKDVLFVTYGVTPWIDIKNAILNEKTIICYYGNRVYSLKQYTATYAYLQGLIGSDTPTNYGISVDSNNRWSNNAIGIENTTNKVSSITEQSTNTQYAAAKAVWTLVAAESASRINGDNQLSETMATQDGILQNQIDDLKSIGRYLAPWNATTGKPLTEPSSGLPYDYNAGDYFVVAVVGATNYKPSGSQYTGAASTTRETSEVSVNDKYWFDGSAWSLIHKGETEVSPFTNSSFGTIKGSSLDGRINAESDGTGSVNGWSTVKDDISDLQSGKQDNIADLATIRTGAALGATALQSETDPTVPSWAKQPNKPTYTAAEVGALPDSTVIPTKTSDLWNDSGFLTEHQDISGKVDKIEGKGLSTNDFTNEERQKLGRIEDGAEINVQSDWEQNDDTKDDFIKNKPTITEVILRIWEEE